MMVGSPLEKLYDVTNMPFDLMEIQGTPEQISAFKAVEATRQCDTAVIIEDVALCFNALKGMPGPYIKDFLGRLGTEGLVKML